MSDRPVIYFVCTGNAARSVMASTMMRGLDIKGDLDVRGAGTLVLEGQPMSSRTRLALDRFGLADPDHRSRQFVEADAADADLVVVMEPVHVLWLRKWFPQVAGITCSFPRLLRDLDPASNTAPTSLEDKVAALGLELIEPEGWEEVDDPAGGEQADFDNCAAELHDLVGRLHKLL